MPALEAAGVDLVLSGHSHSYERSVLMRGHYGDNTTWNSDKHVVTMHWGLPSASIAPPPFQ